LYKSDLFYVKVLEKRSILGIFTVVVRWPSTKQAWQRDGATPRVLEREVTAGENLGARIMKQQSTDQLLLYSLQSQSPLHE
jgi:hypothetical protein